MIATDCNEVALATTEICANIISESRIQTQEDAEEGAVNICALGDGCQWALGDWIIKSCEKLVKDGKDFRGEDGERLVLPSKPKQIQTIIGGICGAVGISKRTAYYAKEISAHWPTWESRAIGILKHTAFIRAWEMTDDPDFWIELAKNAEPPWTPTQLVEAIREALGLEEVGDPIVGKFTVSKIADADEYGEKIGEKLVLTPIEHEMIPFQPEDASFRVRFTKLNPKKAKGG